jgi:hypothetical protein
MWGEFGVDLVRIINTSLLYSRLTAEMVQGTAEPSVVASPLAGNVHHIKSGKRKEAADAAFHQACCVHPCLPVEGNNLDCNIVASWYARRFTHTKLYEICKDKALRRCAQVYAGLPMRAHFNEINCGSLMTGRVDACRDAARYLGTSSSFMAMHDRRNTLQGQTILRNLQPPLRTDTCRCASTKLNILCNPVLKPCTTMCEVSLDMAHNAQLGPPGNHWEVSPSMSMVGG